MHARNRFPVGDAVHKDARADDVRQLCAERVERRLDLVDRKVRLCGGVGPADHAVTVGCGRPRHPDAVPDADGAAVASHRFPRRAARASRPIARSVLRRVHRRERIDMVAQVARGGEVRWLAILVTAVIRNRRQHADRAGDHLPVFRIERELEDALVVRDVLARSESRADDHARDGGLIEDISAGHVRHRDRMPLRDDLDRSQQALHRGPAAGGADEPAVFHL